MPKKGVKPTFTLKKIIFIYQDNAYNSTHGNKAALQKPGYE